MKSRREFLHSVLNQVPFAFAAPLLSIPALGLASPMNQASAKEGPVSGRDYGVPNHLDYVYPELWGAKADNETDSGPAFAKMVSELGNNKRVVLSAGTYLLGDAAKNLFKSRTGTFGMYFQGPSFAANEAGTKLKYIGEKDYSAALFWFNNTTQGVQFSNVEIDCDGRLGTAVRAYSDLDMFRSIKFMVFQDMFMRGFTKVGMEIGNQTLTDQDVDAFSFLFHNAHFRSGPGATCVQVDANNAFNIFLDSCSFGNDLFTDGEEGGTRLRWVRGINGGLTRCFNDDMLGWKSLDDSHYFVQIEDPSPSKPPVTNFHIRDCGGEDWRVLRTRGQSKHRIVVDGWKQGRVFATSLENKAIDAETGRLTISNSLFDHGTGSPNFFPKTIFIGDAAYMWNNWFEKGQYVMTHPKRCWINFTQQTTSPVKGDEEPPVPPNFKGVYKYLRKQGY